MFRANSCALTLTLVWTSTIAFAQDYVLPNGVTVLTESQLADQMFGSTTYNERWADYCEPATDNQKEVRLKGKHKVYGLYGGKCIIKGHLFCWEVDRLPMSEFNDCYLIELKGDLVNQYTSDGKRYYSRWPQIKLTSGNPENL